jgi:hypothetical protein
MKKLFLVLLGLMLSAGASLEAQQRQSTFTTFTVGKVTQEQYATAIAADNRQVLRLPADQILAGVNKQFGLQLANRQALADYIRQLEAGPCPQGQATLARVHRTNQVVDLSGWTRPIRPGEQCLFADNRAMFSLDCGNIVPNLYRTVRPQATAPVTPAPTVYVQPQPTPQVMLPERVAVDANVTHYFAEPLRLDIPPQPRSWMSRNWGWFVVPPLLAGVGVGVYCVVTDECRSRDEIDIVIIKGEPTAVSSPRIRSGGFGLSIPIGGF